jgi:hypothetical protein
VFETRPGHLTEVLRGFLSFSKFHDDTSIRP